MSSFADFALLPSLKATLDEKGIQTPTEIQRRAIPILLERGSLVGVAQTGSGKTMAFVLPILQRLKALEDAGDSIDEDSQPRACVVVPTRELGEQVTQVFKVFTHTTRLRVRSLLGGTSFEMARRSVAGKFEVLVATPGRLTKLLEMGLVKLDDVRILVFDEADQMLDQGFMPDAKRIVAASPADRQMALFSATVSPAVQTLMTQLFSDAEVIRGEGSHEVASSLRTENREVPDGKRFPLLENVLQSSTPGGTMIFTNTRDQCDKLAAELEKSGRTCVVYRGEMDKLERRRNLKKFRDGEVELLVSTDLASRGLDLEHVGRVINYHLPQQMENYLHRVGRTARAGRKGLVINFVTERDEPFIAKLATVEAGKGRKKAGKPEAEWPAEPEHKAPPSPVRVHPAGGVRPLAQVKKRTKAR